MGQRTTSDLTRTDSLSTNIIRTYTSNHFCFHLFWLLVVGFLKKSFFVQNISEEGETKSVETKYPNVDSQVGFPGGSDGKASACTSGDLGSILGLERPSDEENG